MIKKIAIIGILVVVVILVTMQLFSQRSVITPPKTQSNNPDLIEIKNSFWVGGLYLTEVKKTNVEAWAQASSGATLVAGGKAPSSVEILAGYYKDFVQDKMVVFNHTQERESKVSLSQKAQLWVMEEDKLYLVPKSLKELLETSQLKEYLKPGDLVLLPGINVDLESQDLVIFR